MSESSPHPQSSPESPDLSGLDHAGVRRLQDAALSLLETDPQEALRLARRSEAQARALEPEIAGRSLSVLGQAYLATARFQEAYTALSESIRLLTGREGTALAEATVYLSKVCLNLGRFEEAQQLLEATFAVIEEKENVGESMGRVRAMALNQKAGAEYRQGNTGLAIGLLSEALELWKVEGDVPGQIHCLINLGNTRSALGQYDQAIALLSEAYELSQHVAHSAKLEAMILHNLAYAHHSNEDNPRAIHLMRSAHTIIRALGDIHLEASATLNLGTFHLEEGQLDQAQTYLEASLDICQRVRDQFGELGALNSLGNLYEKTGQSLLAYVTYHDALTIAVEIGSTQGELDARLNLGRFYLQAQNFEEARLQLQRALNLAEQTRSAREEATAHELFSTLHKQRGEYEQALLHSEALRRIERELFNAERDRQTRNLSLQFEVERAQREADAYRLRTELEHAARQLAESQVEERTAELARAQHEVVSRLAVAAEYRDGTTGDHTRRVGLMSAALARALGWSEARADLLGIAARLHDVGKMGIPDSILLKRGSLKPCEVSQMQTHTLIGATILSGGHSELLQLSEEIALTHHERWDGSGYPRCLAGAQIPLSGRIVAVADVYDALVHVRPYKRAWTHEEALGELVAQAGRHFDPEVVEAAVRIFQAQSGGTV